MRRQAITWAVLLAFVATNIGCKQQCFVSECDYDSYRALMPQSLECQAANCIAPEVAPIPTPSTVLDPERPIRYLSLNEAVAIALEQGTIGGGRRTFNLGEGPQIDIPYSPGGIRDAVRVLALEPAIAYTDIEASLSRFDARLLSGITWQTNDRPVGTALESFQAGGGINSIQQQLATFTSSLVKPLPTGGVAGVTFRTDYELSNLAQRVNPAYRPSLLFGFEQPLLRGFGTEINQLTAAHPGSALFQYTNAGRVDGILLTRLAFDQSRADFEYAVSVMVLRVENAYWDLYGAYGRLYAREAALRQSFEAWRISKARYEAGRIPIQEFAQARGQYERFRRQRIQELNIVLDQERILRGILNLPAEDGTRLVPIDAPTLADYIPDWDSALNESMSLFPSLILARQDLKAAQLRLIRAKNTLMPDVRFSATYDFNAIGNRIDGPGDDNAFRNLANGDFSNWTMGVRGEIPIGFRDSHAFVRRTRLELAQAYMEVRDQELKVQRYLARAYRDMPGFQQSIQAARAEREAYSEQLQARFKEFLAGRGTFDFLLEAQRNWADALAEEYSNIVGYNKSLVTFQFAKGTLLQYDNVVISEGPLPNCAQVRAVEHQKERSKALVCRERAEPQTCTACGDGGCGTLGAGCTTCTDCVTNTTHTVSTLPALPSDKAPSLLTLAKAAPVPEITEPMPREASVWVDRPVNARTPAAPGAPAASLAPPTTTPSTAAAPAKPPLFLNDAVPPTAAALKPLPALPPGKFANEASAVVPVGNWEPAGKK